MCVERIEALCIKYLSSKDSLYIFLQVIEAARFPPSTPLQNKQLLLFESATCLSHTHTLLLSQSHTCTVVSIKCTVGSDILISQWDVMSPSTYCLQYSFNYMLEQVIGGGTVLETYIS